MNNNNQSWNQRQPVPSVQRSRGQPDQRYDQQAQAYPPRAHSSLGEGQRPGQEQATLDPQLMLRYDANKKSVGISYLFWFFLGIWGAHRFYNGRTGTAIVQLALWLVGVVLSFIGVGFILLGILMIWVLIDAFLIPGWVRSYNNQLIDRLSNHLYGRY